MKLIGSNLLIRVTKPGKDYSTAIKGTVISHGKFEAKYFGKGTEVMFNPHRAVICNPDDKTVFVPARDILAVLN